MSSGHLLTPYSSNKVWRVCLVASLGSFVFGYNVGVVNSTLGVVASVFSWGNHKSILTALVAGSMPFGAMVSSVFSGNLSNKIGTRGALMVSNLITLLGAVVTVIPFTVSFGIGRFISGLSVGIYATLVPLYINETAPTEMSGKLGTLVQIQITTGILLAYTFALVLPTGDYTSNSLTNWWMAMFGFQAVFSMAQFLLFLYVYKLETPVWLWTRNLRESALESLEQVYSKEGAQEVLDRMDSAIDRSSICSLNYGVDLSYLDLFLCKQGTSRIMRLGYLNNFFKQFSGINAILTFSTSIFEDLGGGVFVSRVFTVVVGIINALPAVVASSLVDKFGRKVLLVSGFVGMAVCQLFSGFFAGLLSSSSIVFPVLCILLYMLFFATSTGPICWLYCGEILTPKAMSICTAFSWFCNALALFTFPPLKELLGIDLVFWIYTAVCAVGFVYFAVDMLETKGLSKQQIQRLLTKG